MKVELEKDVLAVIYSNSNAEGRKAIREELGETFSEILPVTKRIKTFEDAMAELSDKHPAVQSYNSVKYGNTADREPDIMAYLKLRVITIALNEGWTPQFIEGEQRWYAWYELLTKEEVETMSEEDKENRRVVGRASHSAGAGGGLVCASAGGVSSVSYTGSGSRLAFKSEELAEYAAKQFAEIYADFCFIPDEAQK